MELDAEAQRNAMYTVHFFFFFFFFFFLPVPDAGAQICKGM